MASRRRRSTASSIQGPEGFDDVDVLVRDYAVQVTGDFHRIRDRTFEALGAHFSEEQIVELTLRIALCGFFNRFNDVLQIEMEDGVVPVPV